MSIYFKFNIIYQSLSTWTCRIIKSFKQSLKNSNNQGKDYSPERKIWFCSREKDILQSPLQSLKKHLYEYIQFQQY